MADGKSDTTIPHAGCKTPSECRKEQVCLDAWHCCRQPTIGESRERGLLDAAEDVLSRWSIIRASNGALGSCGMPDALKLLEQACEAYQDEELANGE